MVWHIETDSFRLQFLPEYGIFYLNIPQSADFIVKALFFEGELSYDFTDEDDYDIYDDSYSIIFSKKIEEYQNFLIKAVIEKRLKAKKHFSIYGELDNNNTFINIFDLNDWLQMDSMSIADTFASFSEKLADIQSNVIDFIAIEKLKMTKKYNKLEKEFIFENDTHLKLYFENVELKKEIENLKNSKEKPLNTKQKENLHNIIASLLGLILGKSSNGKPYSQFNSQQSIIDAIHANYGEGKGLSKRNLEEFFAQAKKRLSELEQKAL